MEFWWKGFRQTLSVFALLALSTCLALSPEVSRGANLCAKIFSGLSSSELPRGLREATLDDVASNSTAGTYMELANAGELIRQMDPRLVEKGIAIAEPGYGLCGPTCVTNVVQTIYASRKIKPPFNAPDMVEWYVKTYPSVAGGNHALRGTDIPTLMSLVNQSAPRIGLSVSKMNPPDGLTDVQLSSAVRKYSKGLIIGLARLRQGDHFLAILSVDTVKKEIVYSDPNMPNRIVSAPYRVGSLRNYSTMQIEMLPGYGSTTTAYFFDYYLLSATAPLAH